MKVHVAWSPREQSSFRLNTGLCACVSPDGSTVLFVGRDVRRASLHPGAQLEQRPLLRKYLEENGIREEDLQHIVGELHLPGGQEQTEVLLQRTVDLIVLSEEPPGNELPDASQHLPDETFDVICQGACWPGYARTSLAPDGDVVANHVVMGSVFPSAAQ